MELTLDQALQKGIEAHRAGKAQEADQYYTAILKLSPRHPDANHNKGVLAVDLGKLEYAIPYFKTALEANTKVAQFWLSYIDALIKLDRLDDAKAIFDQAKISGVQTGAFYKLKDQIRIKNKTIKAFGNTNKHEPATKKYPPQSKITNLIKFYEKGEFNRTLDEALNLIKEFPNSEKLFLILGVTKNALGSLDQAVSAYQKALEIKPDYAEAYYNLGISLNGQGRLDRAVEVYQKALAIRPRYAEAWYNLANIYKSQREFSKAVEGYRNTLSIKPDFLAAYNNLGISYTNKDN